MCNMANLSDLIDNGTEDVLDFIKKQDKLKDYQAEDIIKALSQPHKGILFTHEMGLGKSYLILEAANLALIYNHGKKVIITAPTGSIASLKKLIKANTNWEVQTSNGQEKKVNKLINNFDNIDILLVQKSIWESSIAFHIFMYNNLDKICMSIYDEPNAKDAIGFKSFLDFTRKVDKTVLTNATAIDSDITKAYNVLYAINAINMPEQDFKRKYNMGKSKSDTLNVDKVMNSFGDKIINRNRVDMGINVKINCFFHRVPLTDYQKALLRIKAESRKVLSAPPELKGFINENIQLFLNEQTVSSYRKVMELVDRQKEGENIVIYTRYNAAACMIAERLKQKGKQVFGINGFTTPTPEDKKRVEDAFNKSKGGIAIISIEDAISLNSANKIILYEMPVDVSQTIYRIIRGSENQNVEAHIIYYPEKNVQLLYNKITQMVGNEKARKAKLGIADAFKKEVEYLRVQFGILPDNV